ncbi:hypothetical protein M4D55_23340 [Metabacillus idriensis]|uniref:hypothetical protein n=1 Tax=Metabacillus idriensis TaxID=324768 RepID=UPI00203B5325|nr:hypothetical protein [Metabacillus idriensis]MCM3598697.1 hypothetical protein [Metabacillus idriensis]
MSETVRLKSKELKQLKAIQEYILIHKGVFLDETEAVKFCINEAAVRAKKKKL